MSFSSQRAVCYLVDLAIPVLVAHWVYKTPAMLKCQRFEDSRSDKTEPRGSKHQRLDLRDDEEGEGLDEFEDEGEGKDIEYILFPFVALPRKESNRPTDIGKGTRSLNHLVCIPKIG